MLDVFANIHIWLQRMLVDRRAVTALEFAMIVALIGMAVVTVMTGMGKGVAATLNETSTRP